MPLNETQRRSLFEVLKLVVDSLADIALTLPLSPKSTTTTSSSNDGNDVDNIVLTALTLSVAPLTMDIEQAISILDTHRGVYASLQTGRHSDQINVPDEVRADWQALDQYIQKKCDFKAVDECIKRRRSTLPNFDPIRIADIQVYPFPPCPSPLLFTLLMYHGMAYRAVEIAIW
jgi:hypothetical protein